MVEKIMFTKVQCGGNHFVHFFQSDLVESIKIPQICDPHFGIGADGVLIVKSLELDQENDCANYHLIFFNPDGSEVGLCGNGLMSSVYYLAKKFHIRQFQVQVLNHTYNVHYLPENHSISLQMNNIHSEKKLNLQGYNASFVNTGVEHCCIQINDFEEFKKLKVSEIGKNLSFDEQLLPRRSNINFYFVHSNGDVSLRTFERGVEDETFACGTGITAVALSQNKKNTSLTILARGGKYSVEIGDTLKDVNLIGFPKIVFSGQLEYES